MATINLLCIHAARIMSLVALLAVLPAAAFAQLAAVGVPENATARTYGGGWTCNRGFRKDDGACQAIRVPANAFPTDATYGSGWQCRRGFRNADNNCVAIEIPKNAYLNAFGDSWQCERGFEETGATCVLIKVPENGYLSTSLHASGWRCNRGYRADNEQCVAITVESYADQSLALSRNLAFAPQLAARARPIAQVAAGQSIGQRFSVHPGQHQNLSVVGGADDGRYQALCVEAERISEGCGQRR